MVRSRRSRLDGRDVGGPKTRVCWPLIVWVDAGERGTAFHAEAALDAMVVTGAAIGTGMVVAHVSFPSPMASFDSLTISAQLSSL